MSGATAYQLAGALVASPSSTEAWSYGTETVAMAEFLRQSDPDRDGDGVPDRLDNCTDIVNPAQRDTDGDGFGNMCDADLSGDGLVDFVDFLIFKKAFLTPDPDADFNGDGIVDSRDLKFFKDMFFKPPGPSNAML